MAWDPYYLNDIQTLEKIQRRAARWVMKDYSRYSSVTAMLHELNWPPLQLRRKINRLQMFYKIIYNHTALSTVFHSVFKQHNASLDIIILTISLSPVHVPTVTRIHSIYEL